MFTEEDKQILLDCANTIESGLMRINDNNDMSEIAEAIRFAGERVEHGLCILANAIIKHLPE